MNNSYATIFIVWALMIGIIAGGGIGYFLLKRPPPVFQVNDIEQIVCPQTKGKLLTCCEAICGETDDTCNYRCLMGWEPYVPLWERTE